MKQPFTYTMTGNLVAARGIRNVTVAAMLALIVLLSVYLAMFSFQPNYQNYSPGGGFGCCIEGNAPSSDFGTLVVYTISDSNYGFTSPVASEFTVEIMGQNQNITFKQLNGDRSVNVLEQGNYTVRISELSESLTANVKVVRNTSTSLYARFTSFVLTSSFFVFDTEPFSSYIAPGGSISILASPSTPVFSDASWNLYGLRNVSVVASNLLIRDYATNMVQFNASLVDWYQIPDGIWFHFSLQNAEDMEGIDGFMLIEQHASYEVMSNAT